MMGIAVLMLSLFILKETRPAPPLLRPNHEKIASRCLIGFSQPCCYHHPQRFGDPHFRQYSPVLLMEIMGFERGEYATIMR